MTTHKNFKSPLSIYVLWHSDFQNGSPSTQWKTKTCTHGGQEYASFIYKSFCRDIENPVSRGIGIPVYYRSQKGENGAIAEIPFHESERNALVVLAEGNMLNDASYRQYLENSMHVQSAASRVFFFSLDTFGSKVNQDQETRLYASLYEIEGENAQETFEKRCAELHSLLLHDLCRFLFDRKPSYQSILADKWNGMASIRLFLSHSGADGTGQAKELHAYIHGETKLDTFLNTHDMQIGDNVQGRIAHELDRNSALIVFQTDEYANREWCRDEVIAAKRKATPIIVVNDLKQGETRSFPYLGNAPTVRWRKNCHEIIDLALTQILKQRFANMMMDTLVESYELSKYYQCITIGHSPELFDLIALKPYQHPKKPLLMLYPDPPLGHVELQVLQEAAPQVQFITPVGLPLFKHRNKARHE